jgi:hypothetical protein
MERDEDDVVLGSTRLSGSQRLHRKGDATREAGSLVGPMTAADSPSAISVFRIKMVTLEEPVTPRHHPLGERQFSCQVSSRGLHKKESGNQRPLPTWYRTTTKL